MTTPLPMLSAQNLTAKRSWRVVFAKISLDIHSGDRIYVTGQNGSGKTTLLETLLGLHHSSAGKLCWKGRVGSPHEHQAFVRREVFYLPQRNNLFKSLTLRQNIFIGGTLDGLSSRKILSDALQLIPELRSSLDRQPAEVSIGQRQIAAFLRFLARDPQLVLLDEPTAGISSHLLPMMYELLNSHLAPDSALILTDQHASFARDLCKSAYELKARKLEVVT